MATSFSRRLKLLIKFSEAMFNETVYSDVSKAVSESSPLSLKILLLVSRHCPKKEAI